MTGGALLRSVESTILYAREFGLCCVCAGWAVFAAILLSYFRSGARIRFVLR